MFGIPLLGRIWLTLPVTLLGVLLASSRTIAVPVETVDSIAPLTALAEPIQTLPAIASVASLEPAATSLDEQLMPAGMSQVTSVTQLSDVQPTDWAFQALQSLVEKYGCIVGYPDSTFRGQRAMTRYEFAAGLNACLDRVNELIAAATADMATKEDVATLQRLMEEFAAELAMVRGRVENLEGRVALLEGSQFSTTTKLQGLTFFNVTGATAGDDVRVEAGSLAGPREIRPAARYSDTNRPVVLRVKDDPEITFSNLTWLSLVTSFTGKDLLVTQLAAGNGDSPANYFTSAGLYNTYGVPFTDQTAGPELFGSRNDVILREFFYEFPVSDNFRLVVGPRVNWYRYFDGNAFTFFLTGAGSFNSIGSTLTNTLDRGSGVVGLWKLSNQFAFHFGYLGENTEFLPSAFGFNTSSNPRTGLFSGTNTLTAELTYSPSKNANIRLLYNRSTSDPNVPIQDENGNITGFGIGGATGEPIYGVADDGFGGSIRPAYGNTFGISADWLITPRFGVFGRYGYGNVEIRPKNRDRDGGDINSQAFQVGLAFPDLGKQGALATLSFAMPFDVLEGRRFLASGGGNGGTQYDLEAAYYLPLSANIAIVPSLYWIFNPNNFDNNPTIFVGNLRTQFSF
ncbi:iron uptake porin [Trichothermofontia sichuanensis B231]|uniref:iron uptake porin n=1 Tax=Trichothermofontia sichuanensis TaxID=3045816 RepID=UPI0022469125|nr:iron uptake porin [Trichothermofontia sichuanensis]UZQ55443.1 iron uptake porin [Trichothermofontia sichuanensis B231]